MRRVNLKPAVPDRSQRGTLGSPTHQGNLSVPWQTVLFSESTCSRMHGGKARAMNAFHWV